MSLLHLVVDLLMWHGNRNREAERTQLEERFQQAARIKCPTLIVQGSLSDVFTSEDAQKLANEFRDGHYAQVGEAGHTVQGGQSSGLRSCNGTILGQSPARKDQRTKLKFWLALIPLIC